MGETILIGIAGGTCSGKTTFAKWIAEQIGDGDVLVLSQDAYYRDQSHLPREKRVGINYDHPSALDIDLLIDHLRQLRRSRPIPKLAYDYTTHCRRTIDRKIGPSKVVVVEGLMVLENVELRDLFHIKIYVETDPDVRIIRRIRRDMLERGRDLDGIVRQYLASVRPMHLAFVEPSRRYADFIVPGEGSCAAAGVIAGWIRDLMDSRTYLNRSGGERGETYAS